MNCANNNIYAAGWVSAAPSPRPSPPVGARVKENASVLIIVLWIMFGLVSVTLYFAHTMTFDLRASDNREAGMEAEQAIEGARRYVTCVLSNVATAGVLPDTQTYQNEAVPIGDAHYWLIGRGDSTDSPTVPHFGLVDESSKINLNTASSNILINLPRMTPELVANILAWRSTNTSSLAGGAESDTYSTLPEPYTCKNSPFETIDELRMIYDMDAVTLYGEDANLNGVLDPNENDGDKLPPTDNLDGTLDPGLLEYCTTYTIEPTTYTNVNSSGVLTNSPRVNVTNLTALRTLLTQKFDATTAGKVLGGFGRVGPSTVLAFYYACSNQLTAAQFVQLEPALRGASVAGLINVNTASTAVLACVPGLTNGQAAQLTAYRQSNSNAVFAAGPTVSWVTQVLQPSDALLAAPYLTGHGYQFTADIVAVGHDGRGYRRTRFVFDTSKGVPIILHRQDLSYLGWALGKDVRDKWLLAKQTR